MFLHQWGPYAPSVHILSMRTGEGASWSYLLAWWAGKCGSWLGSDSSMAVGGQGTALARPGLMIIEQDPIPHDTPRPGHYFLSRGSMQTC